MYTQKEDEGEEEEEEEVAVSQAARLSQCAACLSEHSPGSGDRRGKVIELSINHTNWIITLADRLDITHSPPGGGEQRHRHVVLVGPE